MREDVVAAILTLLQPRNWVNIGYGQALFEIFRVELALGRLASLEIDHSGDFALRLSISVRDLHGLACSDRISIAPSGFCACATIVIRIFVGNFVNLDVQIREKLAFARGAQIRRRRLRIIQVTRITFQTCHSTSRGLILGHLRVEFPFNQ